MNDTERLEEIVKKADRDQLLPKHVARVDLFNHLVRGHAGFSVPVQYRKRDWGNAPMSRKQCEMKIQAPTTDFPKQRRVQDLIVLD